MLKIKKKIKIFYKLPFNDADEFPINPTNWTNRLLQLVLLNTITKISPFFFFCMHFLLVLIYFQFALESKYLDNFHN